MLIPVAKTERYDSEPHKHIQEPVLASIIVVRRGIIRPLRQGGGAIYGEAMDQAATAGNLLWVAGASVAGTGAQVAAQEGVNAVKNRVKQALPGKNQRGSARIDIGSNRLPDVTYMAVGATSFGLYALGKPAFISGRRHIESQLLHISREWVEDFRLEWATVTVAKVRIDFVENRTLEAEYQRMYMGKGAEKMRSLLGRNR